MSIRTLRKETVKKKGLSLKFPLRKGLAGGFAVNETTIDSVKDDLRVLLITNHGERLVNFDFGANLRSLIFENMTQDLEEQIKTAVFVAIEKWMPFLIIKNIQVKTGQQDLSLGPNEVRIKVFFGIASTDLDDSIEVRIRS